MANEDDLKNIKHDFLQADEKSQVPDAVSPTIKNNITAAKKNAMNFGSRRNKI